MHAPRVCAALTSATDPLVVDLGYGALPVTTLEFAARLRRIRPDVRVVGLEIDPERVRTARTAATDAVDFALGGFELAGLHPVLVRAFNVLRQYPVDEVAAAWSTMQAALPAGGLILDGTCDEIGRRSCWVLLDRGGPVSLTLACDPGTSTDLRIWPSGCRRSSSIAMWPGSRCTNCWPPRTGPGPPRPPTGCSGRENVGAPCSPPWPPMGCRWSRPAERSATAC